MENQREEGKLVNLKMNKWSISRFQKSGNKELIGVRLGMSIKNCEEDQGPVKAVATDMMTCLQLKFVNYNNCTLSG